MENGKLFVVATPIGNLKDITIRALETLKSSDLIVAEDTRVSRKLLAHYDIKKPVMSLHRHSPEKSYQKVEEWLKNGKTVAVLSDAGTPGISDPGPAIIRRTMENVPNLKVSPIPGPSAPTTALSVSGLNADHFTFLGYPPRKKRRDAFFKNLRAISVKPVVIYETPHRLQKTLGDLEITLGNENIIIAKELTKIHETVWQGKINEAKSQFLGKALKGEFTLILP